MHYVMSGLNVMFLCYSGLRPFGRIGMFNSSNSNKLKEQAVNHIFEIIIETITPSIYLSIARIHPEVMNHNGYEQLHFVALCEGYIVLSGNGCGSSKSTCQDR